MARTFVYDNRTFPDPDANMTVEQVKTSLSDFFGELANAETKMTTQDDGTEVIEFIRRVGTKGRAEEL